MIVCAGDTEISIPTRWQLCSRCEGAGVHDHPAFANGISAEEMHADPDFAEEYQAGHYDVVCAVCSGRRVEAVADESLLDDDQRRLLEEHREAEALYLAEVEAERRAGA